MAKKGPKNSFFGLQQGPRHIFYYEQHETGPTHPLIRTFTSPDFRDIGQSLYSGQIEIWTTPKKWPKIGTVFLVKEMSKICPYFVPILSVFWLPELENC